MLWLKLNFFTSLPPLCLKSKWYEHWVLMSTEKFIQIYTNEIFLTLFVFLYSRKSNLDESANKGNLYLSIIFFTRSKVRNNSTVSFPFFFYILQWFHIAETFVGPFYKIYGRAFCGSSQWPKAVNCLFQKAPS